MTKPLLEVEDLWVSFPGVDRSIDVVRGISFSIGREKVGIVGESGSGKSMTGRSILKLTPKAAQIKAKKLQFGDVDLLGASERQMRSVRGNKISMILQDPKYSLNPLIRIGDQIMEAYRLHHRVNKQEARQRTLNMLEAVHIRDAERVMNLFPHEISGGMGQRVMIAMMLIPEPDMIIADEPTSALDVSVQAEILNLLKTLRRERGLTYLMVSHDLAVVAHICERVGVMHKGIILEELTADDLRQSRASAPYTQEFLQASVEAVAHN